MFARAYVLDGHLARAARIMLPELATLCAGELLSEPLASSRRV